MKRKKWSEIEEQTLLSKYSELVDSGVLSKLKTREKKFKPVADHVNSLHHLRDPISFPFKWTWRDVSIKVQNMRHQYLGVKQKIRVSEDEFNWGDGENHWENFLKYKEVFGDIELSETAVKDKKFGEESISDVLGIGYGVESEDDEEAEEEEEQEQEQEDEMGDVGGEKDGNLECFLSKLRNSGGLKWRRRLKMMKISTKVLELREVILRREEKRREGEWNREVKEPENHSSRTTREMTLQNLSNQREQQLLDRELEMEEAKLIHAKQETQKRLRLEKELTQEKRRRMETEQKWEEQHMEWKEKMLEMQIEHEKQMMRIQADACQTQLQILGLVARVMCHFFGGPSNHGLGHVPATPMTATQDLQNLGHQGGLGDPPKPPGSLPSVFH